MGDVFAENFDITITDLLKRPVFEQNDGNWIDILPTVTKHSNTRFLSSIKLSPMKASLKKNEGYAYKFLLDKRKKVQPKFQVNDLVGTAVISKMFSKSDMTKWSYKLYKDTAIINDTIPCYSIDNLAERYNEALLKKTEITMKENKDVMKKLNIT